jgi:hypothetical protein
MEDRRKNETRIENDPILNGVLRDVSLGTVFKGVFLLWIADIVRLILVPWLSLWLVGAM